MVCIDCVSEIERVFLFRLKSIKSNEYFEKLIFEFCNNTFDLKTEKIIYEKTDSATKTVKTEELFSNNGTLELNPEAENIHCYSETDEENYIEYGVDCVLEEMKTNEKNSHCDKSNECSSFKCDICNKRFRNKEYVKRHIRQIHKAKIKGKSKYQDNVIDSAKPEPFENFEDSIEKPNNLSNQFITTQCTEKLTPDTKLKRKINKMKSKRQTDMPEPIKIDNGYACPLCDKQFTDRKYVPYHIRRVHLKVLYPHKLSQR